MVEIRFLTVGVESYRKAREGNEMIHVVTNYEVGDISMNLLCLMHRQMATYRNTFKHMNIYRSQYIHRFPCLSTESPTSNDILVALNRTSIQISSSNATLQFKKKKKIGLFRDW